MSRHGLRPGKILWEVQEAYQPGVVGEKLTRGPLEYAAIWQVAQRMTDRPVKFGAICAPSMAGMLWNAFYKDDKEMMLELCDIMNAELRDMAAAGCPLIQVEEPPHHMRAQQKECTDADLEFLTEAFNRQLKGVNAEIWVHTCWGNPNQQRVHYNVPSYERALPHLLQLNGDVLTIECASSDGKDLPLFKHIKTDKKIAIGVVNHCDTVVEPAEKVAALIRKALEFIPKEQLIISTDCGFGREGLSRRIAFYKCVALVEGTNIVRRELGLPEARVRAADPKLVVRGARTRRLSVQGMRACFPPVSGRHFATRLPAGDRSYDEISRLRPRLPGWPVPLCACDRSRACRLGAAADARAAGRVRLRVDAARGGRGRPPGPETLRRARWGAACVSLL